MIGDMNGNSTAVQMALDAQQREQAFDNFIKAALEQARAALPPGFAGSAFFVHEKDRSLDKLITAVDPRTLFVRLADAMRRANIPLPVVPGSKTEALDKAAGEPVQADDPHLLLINLVAAARRVMPFLSGPGSETARNLLLAAIKNGGAEQKARQVVAGFVSTIPGLDSTEVPLIDAMLADAIEGKTRLQIVPVAPLRHVEQINKRLGMKLVDDDARGKAREAAAQDRAAKRAEAEKKHPGVYLLWDEMAKDWLPVANDAEPPEPAA